MTAIDPDHTLSPAPFLNSTTVGERLELAAAGPWTATHANALEQRIKAITVQPPSARSVAVDLRAIEQEAEQWGADLIVVGTHGRRGFRRLLLGSVAENLIRISTKPVLLVRAE